MKVYDAAHVRNAVLVGHQGSGKTTLGEAMLYHAGAVSRQGSIADGTTVSDYNAAETQRKMSVFTAALHAEWEGHKLNLLDAPGYPDFVGELAAGLKAADLALLVVNAVEGVQVGTEVAWGHAAKTNKPVVFVVNHADKPGTDFAELAAHLQERFGRAVTVLQFPATDGAALVDVLLMKQLRFPKERGKIDAAAIDEGGSERAAELRTELVELIAENDEKLMEAYLESGELGEEQLGAGLRAAIRDRQIFPVVVASATEGLGVARLMSFLYQCCPSPADVPAARTGEGREIPCDAAGPPVAFVFRTLSEPHVGEFFFLRVCSGTLEQGMDLENEQTGTMERLGALFAINGQQREPVAKLMAGDLGAVVKLKDTHTNDTLHPKGEHLAIEPIAFPDPRFTAAIRTLTPGEEDKLSAGLHKIVEEDPSLRLVHDALLNQLLLAGQGEMQLEIARFRMKNRYGVDVELSTPRVSYREAIQTGARASYRHKKQTGGAGQFADVSLIVEPLKGEYKAPPDIKVRDTSTVDTAWGAKIEMIDAIVSGVIDMRRFAGAIQKGVLEAMHNGPVAGYPCGDVRVVVYDGKMHAVDSNETAFRVAARMCFREAFGQAQPVMLEPIFDVEVLVPEDYTGDVIGDLNTRRARIQGMDSEGAVQKILAEAPEAELLRYSTVLRSLTQGRGLHRMKFNRYDVVPRQVQDKLVEEARKAKEGG
ncbi:MAG: elongation factor G [Deltaproteobacteria bacterium]|nr:elongation factor G [Deltaproteobacteria bacterium]